MYSNALVKILGYEMEGRRFESWLRCHVLVRDIILPLRPSSQANHWNTNGNNKFTSVSDHVRSIDTEKQERVRAAICADVRSSLDPHRKLE